MLLFYNSYITFKIYYPTFYVIKKLFDIYLTFWKLTINMISNFNMLNSILSIDSNFKGIIPWCYFIIFILKLSWCTCKDLFEGTSTEIKIFASRIPNFFRKILWKIIILPSFCSIFVWNKQRCMQFEKSVLKWNCVAIEAPREHIQTKIRMRIE